MAVYRTRTKWRSEVFQDGIRVASQSGFSTKAEAKSWHDETLVAYQRGEVKEKVPAKKFEDLLAKYRAYHEPTLSASTRTRYGTEIEHRIEPYFRHMDLERIDTLMLEGFKAELGKVMLPASANYCLDTLKLLLNRAVRWKMLPVSPYDIDPFPEPETTYQWWDDKRHIQAFLECARERTKYFPIYLLALETGLRYGECVGLWKESVDLNTGRIYVDRQWKQELRDYKLPKYGKKRWVDIDPKGFLASVLRETKARSEHGKLMFYSSTGRELTRSKVADKIFFSIQERAKVPAIGFHDQRHTFASWYMEEHDNIWALKALLGHASINTTMRYAHHSKRLRHKPLGLVDSFITHNSRTHLESEKVTGENHEEKPWWRIGDSKSITPTLKKPCNLDISLMKTGTSA